LVLSGDGELTVCGWSFSLLQGMDPVERLKSGFEKFKTEVYE
jgi:hypothetical protein